MTQYTSRLIGAVGLAALLALPAPALAGRPAGRQPYNVGRPARVVALLHAFAARHDRGFIPRPARISDTRAALTRAARANAVNSSALSLPDSAWPAGHAQVSSQELSATEASASSINIFADPTFHRSSYIAGKVQSALFQQTHFQPSGGGSDTDLAFWLGSVYADPGGASHMLNDALSTLKAAGLTDQPCYLVGEPNCHLFVLPITIPDGGLLVALYATWQRDNVLGEALVLGGSWTTVHSATAIGHGLQGLLAGAESVMAAATPGAAPTGTSPTGPSPTITLDTTSLLHDVRGTLKTTGALRVNEMGIFLVTFHMSAIGVYYADGSLDVYAPQARIAFLQNSRVIFDGSASFETTPNGDPYFDSIGTFTKKSAVGTLQARFTASLGDATNVRTFTFVLNPAKKKSKAQKR